MIAQRGLHGRAWRLQTEDWVNLHKTSLLIIDSAAGHGKTLDHLALLAESCNPASIRAAVLLSRLTDGCETALDARLSGGLTQLQYLDLLGTQVTDAGLQHLKGLTRLQSLVLAQTKVTNAGLVHLKWLTQLQTLNLCETSVTGAGLEYLKGLTRLQSLDLSQTKVTGAELEHLKGLTQLQSLDLTQTAVTDAGLKHLQGLTTTPVIGPAFNQSDRRGGATS